MRRRGGGGGVAAVVAAGAVACVGAQLTSCSWTTAGSTYDLSTMTSLVQYQASDVRDPTTQYFFNLCAATPSPLNLTPPTACLTNGRTYNSLAAAGWQVETANGGQSCYRLGNFSMGWNFTLFDPAYPARGVVLSYTGGDGIWCPWRSPRTLSIALICALVPPTPASYSAVTVLEENTCSYVVQLPSIAGCPTQCLTGGNTLCNGHGVCGYNQDASRSQCYCYNGYQGATCGDSVPSSSGMTVEGVLLIIVCIALAGVLALVAYMVVRLRKLNVNPEAYGQLEGRFNELGQMA